MIALDPDGFALERENLQHWAYEYAYKDGRINVSSLINDLEIPTIGVINGHATHAEICLMCDLTLCAEEAVIFDPHYDMGSVPGDGIHSCLQELMGVKRAAYALITGQRMANNYAARPTGGRTMADRPRDPARHRQQDRPPKSGATANSRPNQMLGKRTRVFLEGGELVTRVEGGRSFIIIHPPPYRLAGPPGADLDLDDLAPRRPITWRSVTPLRGCYGATVATSRFVAA